MFDYNFSVFEGVIFQRNCDFALLRGLKYNNLVSLIALIS